MNKNKKEIVLDNKNQKMKEEEDNFILTLIKDVNSCCKKFIILKYAPNKLKKDKKK